MTTTPDLLAGPFMTSLQITDSRDTDEYALTPEVAPGSPGTVAYALSRLARMEQNR